MAAISHCFQQERNKAVFSEDCWPLFSIHGVSDSEGTGKYCKCVGCGDLDSDGIAGRLGQCERQKRKRDEQGNVGRRRTVRTARRQRNMRRHRGRKSNKKQNIMGSKDRKYEGAEV